MSYEAKVFRILIASPSDVIEEREIVVKSIQEWNDLHSPERQIVLLPLRWETHTTPEYGKRPQEIINRQIVDHCDLVIGVFWTRIGSPTGKEDSGTLEEIDRVASSGKPVMLYFSNVKSDLEQLDLEQLEKLRTFKKNTYPKALVENYSSQIEFRDKLVKQIEMQLRTLISNGTSPSGSIKSDILLEFYDLQVKNHCGEQITLKTDYLKLNNTDKIPDYITKDTPKSKVSKNDFKISFFDDENKDYYRDYCEYLVNKKLFIPINFWLKNEGNLGAKDLFIDIKIISDNKNIEIISSNEFRLEKPTKHKSGLAMNWTSRSDSSKDTMYIKKNSENEWSLNFELNALQPKREICPNSLLYIGAKESCKLTLNATIYADSLPEPISHELNIDLNINTVEIDAVSLLENIKE